jgi:hypothetical protein
MAGLSLQPVVLHSLGKGLGARVKERDVSEVLLTVVLKCQT